MLRIEQNSPFIACWTESNQQLNSNRGEALERSIRKVKDIILYIPNLLIAAVINPRSSSPFHPSPQLVENYGSFAKEIITPDQVSLTANVQVAEKATSDTPTVILFNPLGADDSMHWGLKASLIQRECNVITFNYRGLGSTRKAEDLVIDGESIYQYATQELGTNKNKVYFYGHSLGGALAAQVKALHPESEGKYVGDRTFKSVFSLITENCCIERLGRVIKKITSSVSAFFIAFPLYYLGWEWDSSKAMMQLKGDKRIVYHPNDCLVPLEASLASQCNAEQLIRLDPNQTGLSTHFFPIDRHNTAEGARAVTIIADFLSR